MQYEVISGGRLDSFKREVQKLLDSGWSLSGELIVTPCHGGGN